ncbi:MAG: hypothetical protein AAB393_13555, partial [Bacteroidota bacterium]
AIGEQALVTVADVVLYIGAAIGLVACWEYRRRMLPIGLAVAFFFLTAVMFHAEARFRLPIMPFICILFGYAATVVFDKARRIEFVKHRQKQIAAGLAIAGILCVYAYTGMLFLTGKV